MQAQLPVPPQGTIEIIVDVYAEADFVCPQPPASLHSAAAPGDYGASSLTHYSSVSTSGHASLPSRVGSPHHRRNEPQNSSFRSTISGGPPSLAALTLHPGGGGGVGPSSLGSQYNQHIEAQVRFKYSGGDALTAGYCRQCAVSFNLELLPSVQITSWDVLPAEV